MTIKKRAISEYQKLHRKQVILETAFNLFIHNEYQDISMDLVAKKAKLAKGTLYLYFKSKEELFFSLKIMEYHHWFDEIEKKIKNLSKRPASKQERIKKFSNFITKSFEQRKNLIRLIIIVHHTLEKNINEELVLNLNQQIGNRLLQLGAQLENLFSFLNPSDGARLVFYIKTIALGMYQVSEPVAVIREMANKNKKELNIMMLDFKKEVQKMIEILLNGWS